MKLTVVILVMAVVFFGCSTPQTVKQSLFMADEAVGVSRDALGDNASATVTVPLDDARKLLSPVKSHLGEPETVIPYSSTEARSLAQQAEMEVRLQNLIKAQFSHLAESVLPARLGKLVSGQGKGIGTPTGLPAIIESVIAVVLGYLGAKGGIKGCKALVSLKRPPAETT